MKATDCKHALACHEHDFHDRGADAEQCLVDCELMGEFMEIGFDCGKGHCRLYERREEVGE